MFRTKSLSNKEMSSLVEKYRPSKCHKQNRNYSLRTLIADKTCQYHRHMEKLVKETCDIIYSNKKTQGRSNPKLQLANLDMNDSQLQTKQLASNSGEVIEIQQFVPSCGNEQVELLQNSLATIQQEAPHDSSDDSPATEMKSAFKMQLENEQLACQNDELRRQIEHLQQRLEIAELIKIQKQSESEGLKLKLKMLALKLQQLTDQNQTRQQYHTRFSTCKPIYIRLNRIEREQTGAQVTINQTEKEIQTNQTIKGIEILQQELEKQGRIQNCVESSIRQFGQFIDQFNLPRVQDRRRRSQQNSLQTELTICFSSWAQSFTEMNAISEARLIQLTRLKQKHGQLQEQQSSRISKLVRLLDLSEMEIKRLLARLRESRDQDVANFKQMSGSIMKLKRDPYSADNGPC